MAKVLAKELCRLHQFPASVAEDRGDPLGKREGELLHNRTLTMLGRSLPSSCVQDPLSEAMDQFRYKQQELTDEYRKEREAILNGFENTMVEGLGEVAQALTKCEQELQGIGEAYMVMRGIRQAEPLDPRRDWKWKEK